MLQLIVKTIPSKITLKSLNFINIKNTLTAHKFEDDFNPQH